MVKKGEIPHNWKGEYAGYGSKHDWIRDKKGRPAYCEVDPSHKRNSYDWANIDHRYRRHLDDYVQMCRSCHMKHDFAKGLRKGHPPGQKQLERLHRQKGTHLPIQQRIKIGIGYKRYWERKSRQLRLDIILEKLKHSDWSCKGLAEQFEMSYPWISSALKSVGITVHRGAIPARAPR